MIILKIMQNVFFFIWKRKKIHTKSLLLFKRKNHTFVGRELRCRNQNFILQKPILTKTFI